MIFNNELKIIEYLNLEKKLNTNMKRYRSLLFFIKGDFMKYTKEILEFFLFNNFEIINDINKNFGGKHAFTHKVCFNSGKYEAVLWKNDTKFYLIAGPKGNLSKVFFSNNTNIEIYEEKELDEIFLHARLTQELNENNIKRKITKI